MSKTETVTASSTTNSAVRSESAPPPRPTRDQVVDAVRDEMIQHGTHCSYDRAEGFVDMMSKAVRMARFTKYARAYRLDPSELMHMHPILEQIMPDDVENPPAGSAHDLIQRYLLEGSEFSVVHTREGSNLCVVAVRTRNI